MSHTDLVCFARNRMNETAHRTGELMRRCARERRVFYVEQPVHTEGDARVEVLAAEDGLSVVVPHLPQNLPRDTSRTIEATLVAAELASRAVDRPIVWLTSGSTLSLASGVDATVIVHDLEAPATSPDARHLAAVADVLFTANAALHAASVGQHPNVVHLPSAADELGWDAAWADAAAALARPERRWAMRSPARDTLTDDEMAEATQPVGLPV